MFASEISVICPANSRAVTMTMMAQWLQPRGGIMHAFTGILRRRPTDAEEYHNYCALRHIEVGEEESSTLICFASSRNLASVVRVQASSA